MTPTAAAKGADSNVHEFAIDVRDLNKSFGDKHVVIDVSLQVRPGEIMGFLGPNGSGKTTCMRMMCGLLRLDSGSGTCLGYDIVRESAQIRRRAGYMTQKFSFWDDLTIRENLDFVARIYEMPDRRQVVDRALDGLGLSARSNQLAGALSGGWKQRLALAACMLHEPKLLLLDEPTSGVDPTARRDFWIELRRLASTGISVLVSTHYMDEAQLCNQLAYIAYGKLLAKGSEREVIEAQHLATWSVSGNDNVALTDRLRALPGAAQVVPFGSTLHVSGPDAGALRAALEALAGSDASLRVAPIATTLEDVFIYLMARSTDNYAPAPAAAA